jgi:uncharacterized protein YndB with AHSA1/START domain
MATSTDRIEKQILIKAPRARVWQALTDTKEFSEWFRADVRGSRFVQGSAVRGPITWPGYEHLVFDVQVERVEPETLLSWRWHPGAARPEETKDEPTTLVVFELQEVPEGTLLKVTESGFDRIPLARRAKAFKDNDGGWAGQVQNLAQHVTGVRA